MRAPNSIFSAQIQRIKQAIDGSGYVLMTASSLVIIAIKPPRWEVVDVVYDAMD